ncbi:MAG: hypothetical protein ACR2N2_04985 [Acidimicrobiia bacterium]
MHRDIVGGTPSEISNQCSMAGGLEISDVVSAAMPWNDSAVPSELRQFAE